MGCCFSKSHFVAPLGLVDPQNGDVNLVQRGSATDRKNVNGSLVVTVEPQRENRQISSFPLKPTDQGAVSTLAQHDHTVVTQHDAVVEPSGKAIRSQINSQIAKTDFSALKRIDEHVRMTPPSATKSLQTLAEHLSSTATSDLEKIRAVYKWITANISYDTDGFFGRKTKKLTDAESVLTNRTSVCDGYASLVLSLCELVGIECKKISGYSKGFGYDPLKPLTTSMDTNHAWNAVKLNGEWRFIESTWGAGHLNGKNEFEKKETDFYFLTDPEIFIDAHFPYMNSDMKESKKWQLMKNPIDLDTFHSRVRREKSCFEHQVELTSHSHTLIDVKDEVTLKFKGTGKPLTGFSTNFVNPSTGEKVSSGKHIATVLNHRTNEATVTARPPTSGTLWKLQVFGTTVENHKTLDMLVSYQLRSQIQPSFAAFPDITSYYGLHRNHVKCGFTRAFCANQGFWIKAKGGEHELELPISQSVFATTSFKSADGSASNDRFSFVEMHGEFLRISLRTHQAGFHQLDLFCKDVGDNGNSFPLLAKFLIECVRPMERPRPFPVSYKGARDGGVILECPRDGELPANSEIQFKLRSPTLKKVMVDDVVLSKGDAGFDFTVNSGSPGRELSIFGAADEKAKSYTGLYAFKVV